ncbi:hypothetical protein HMPREF9104_00489 [Lentilactobacillus kisonensis F0435]|nr:hypothetical protein HMPREF9104_00489 [Lentilactobacillus kisonensis F0435]
MYQPFLQEIFNTGPLNVAEWVFLFCIPIPLFLLEEARKWAARKISKNN